MNNTPIPYIPYNFPYINNQNIELEIIKINKEIKAIKEKIKYLEKQNKEDYLEKEDGLYMI